MRHILLAILLSGCSQPISPAVASVTHDILKTVIDEAKKHGQALPKFAHECTTEYVEGKDYNVLLALCEWRMPHE